MIQIARVSRSVPDAPPVVESLSDLRLPDYSQGAGPSPDEVLAAATLRAAALLRQGKASSVTISLIQFVAVAEPVQPPMLQQSRGVIFDDIGAVLTWPARDFIELTPCASIPLDETPSTRYEFANSVASKSDVSQVLNPCEFYSHINGWPLGGVHYLLVLRWQQPS